MAAISADAAPSESVAAQALSSAARARATADAELARKAVELVPDEMLNLRADVLVELAEVLQRSGDRQGAKDAVEEAAGLYERKGNLAAIALISL
jgi:predicted Zn-dependent protease with MMP-like domain